MGRLVAFLLFFNGLVFAESQPLVPLIGNIPGRRTVNLDGPWHVIVDPYETGLRGRFYENATTETPGGGPIEYNFEASETLNVPGDWNTQKEKLFFYEGPVWYKRTFSYRRREHTRVFVYFGAANYFTRVYLNGKPLGEHEGGFTPFNLEVTGGLVDGENFLVVEVEQRTPCGWSAGPEYGLVELRRNHARCSAGGSAGNFCARLLDSVGEGVAERYRGMVAVGWELADSASHN